MTSSWCNQDNLCHRHGFWWWLVFCLVPSRYLKQLPVGTLRTNFSEMGIKIHLFSFNKMTLKMWSVKWQPFCSGIRLSKVYLLSKSDNWDGITYYSQTSNISRTLGNKIVDHTDVVGASPIGTAPTTSSHDGVIKWKHFPCNCPFMQGIHRSRWIPHTKASDAELLCFLWSASE